MASCSHSHTISYTCTICEKEWLVELPKVKKLGLRATVQEMRKLESLQLRMEFLQLRMEFLRCEVPSGQAEETPKSDVVIVVGGETDKPLYAHKTILAQRSSVFRMMFESKMLEEETGTIAIDDATLPVIRAVIGFCYRAEIYFTQDVAAEDVLAVAHKYAMDPLQKVCEEHLVDTIDVVNLPKRLKLAKKFQTKELESKALQFLRLNFDEGIVRVIDEL